MRDKYLRNSALASDVVYKKSGLGILRKIGGEYILVPLSGEIAKQGSIYSLNRIAAHIWELINGERNVKQILDELAQIYKGVQLKVMKDDLQYLLTELDRIGFITTVR